MTENLEYIIAEKRNSLKTDRLDMSFGELMNMYEDGELFITPEYQRVFRWSMYQQTRFIESVLLGVPIPPIFVAEDGEGKWEVVDGLQRMSTILAFFGLLKSRPDKNETTLSEGEIIKELEGVTVETLPIKLKTSIKRAVCRVEIVRWDSEEDIRYELFNRLNTGASPLSEQEIRNCIFRAYPVDFNQLLRDLSKNSIFERIISPSKNKKDEMFLEELVLKYFAFKHLPEDQEIKTTLPQFLTDFMRSVSKQEFPFDLGQEAEEFSCLMDFLGRNYDKTVFRPKGNFAAHIFESISYALPKSFGVLQGNEAKIRDKIDTLIRDEEYNDISSSTYSNARIKKRGERALEIFRSA